MKKGRLTHGGKMRKSIVCILAIFLLLFQTQFVVGREHTREKKSWIKVPKDFDTIQQAIDAAVDGDTIKVEEGLYEEVLTIAGKRVNIIGDKRPKIHGTKPRAIGRAETASGLVNYIAGGSGIFKGFVLHGGDTGIFAYSQEAPAGAIEVSNCEIRDNNRGVLVGWGGPVVLKELTISNTAWHGIVAKAIKLQIADVVVVDSKGVGVLVKDTVEPCGTLLTGDNSIINATIMNNVMGGIVVFKSLVCIGDSTIYGNGFAGIRIIQSEAHVWNNYIGYTYPDLFTGNFGDGIIIVPYNLPSTVFLFHNDIEESARAGVANFGSYAWLDGNSIQCAAFELEGENLVPGQLGPGLPSSNLSFQFDHPPPPPEDGGNSCGCFGDGSCVAVSAGLAPPEPAAPAE